MRPTGDSVAHLRRRPGVVRRAVVRFTVWSVLAFLVIGVSAAAIGHQIAKEVALDNARQRGSTVAHTVVAPMVNRRVRAGDRDALEQFDRLMGARLFDGSLRHMKVWSKDGRVLWSDEHMLVGRRFPLPGEVRELVGTGDVHAEVSDLSKAENETERSEGELLEVYVGAHDSENQPFVFEAYLTTGRIRAYERTLQLYILPLALGGMVLLLLVMLPLAASLARAVGKGEAEHSRMMRHTLLVSTQERRRLAQDLHDGVIANLTGVSMALPAVAGYLPSTPEATRAAEILAQASSTLQDTATDLRGMMTELYPPDLDSPEDLGHAVEDLAQTVREHGTEVEVVIPRRHDQNPETTMLAYRVMREGLRNVLKHAHAAHARVELGRRGRLVHVTVRDDGVGVRPDEPVAEGHLGLELLRDAVADFGGDVTLTPRPGGGTVLDATFPPISLPD